ncbi:hypothetical protein [Nocardiopsis composta]|uniref:Uncharacterized protein n=1 Tax=Nocardiopsis composta TaxID=157465 RepID=A0A7W8VCR8_9ACTN|nr:hypothetical protein [Nocardiopsis composta]MBB5431169.1 hypothetical protein [Nocardiopsis composta]
MASDPAEFRAWVRRNHPDAGGDPRAFAEGLARWNRGAGAPGTRGVTVRRRPRTPIAAAAEALRRAKERRERRRRLL